MTSTRRPAIRLPYPEISTTVRPRYLVVSAVILTLLVGAVGWALTIGDIPLTYAEVFSALSGTADRGIDMIVNQWRMPRVLTGLMAGVAFGISGAIFQTMTRNPLASPDIIGVTQGAGLAVAAGFALGWHESIGISSLALVGALAVAVLIYLLAWKRGTTGYRIILVGVGIGWICTSTIDYLVLRTSTLHAQGAVGWMVGNLNNRNADHVIPLAVALAVLLPVVLLLSRWLRLLQLGDDVAIGLGTPVQRARGGLMVTAVGLVAFGTAAAGPIAFVALAAPQIAKRLVATAWPPLLAGGLTGGLIVVTADGVAQIAMENTELPVGVVTGIGGALFLLWLLIRTHRTGSGG